MMERQHRLVRSSDFARVRKQGRSWAHPLLILSVGRNELGASRFGFVVSKRIGKAVIRNRVKRQLREAVRRHLAEVPQGWDYVLVARLPIVEAPFAEIDSAVAHSLARARAWIEERRSAANSGILE